MTDTARFLAATALFLAGSVLMAGMLVALPPNTIMTSVLIVGIGAFVLYPVSKLTWLRGVPEWRYWAICGIATVAVPTGEFLRREHFDASPQPLLQWFTAVLMCGVIAMLAVHKLRRR